MSVWRRLLGGLDQIDRLVDGDARAALQAHVRALVGPALERLGWDERPDDADRDRELRGALIGALANLGADPDARARVAELFDRYCADSTSVEANVAAAVVRATAATAGPAEIDTIIDHVPGRRHAPGGAAVPLRPGRGPRPGADGPGARPGHDRRRSARRTRRSSSASCIANRDNGALAWRLVHERWDEMNERFPSNSIVRMLSGIRSVADPALAADIEAFTAEHPVPQAKQTLQQHLERMRVSVGLRDRTAGQAR